MLRRFPLILVCVLAGCRTVPEIAAPEFSTEKLIGTTDLMQTDERAQLDGGGRQHCGPVSVANSLVYLGRNGYPNLLPELADGGAADESNGLDTDHAQAARLAALLGSRPYMNTSLEDGTGATALMRGVERRVSEAGYQIEQLAYQGWRGHLARYGTGVTHPNPEWIKRSLQGPAAVWLNIGWYRHDAESDIYERIGGHWVTLVGYGVNESGARDANIFILHDPGTRTGREVLHQYVRYQSLQSGMLQRENGKELRPAAGYLILTDNMKIKRGATHAVLDGVVALRLKTP